MFRVIGLMGFSGFKGLGLYKALGCLNRFGRQIFFDGWGFARSFLCCFLLFRLGFRV